MKKPKDYFLMGVFLTLVLCTSIQKTFAQANSNLSPFFIQNENLVNQDYERKFGGGILVPPNESDPVHVEGTSHVDIVSGSYIRLLPGFSSTDFGSTGYFHAYIEQPFELAILEPGPEVRKLEKLELGIGLPPSVQAHIDDFLNGVTNSLNINPYDREYYNSDSKGISIEVDFLAPSTHHHKVYGFYYRQFQHDFSSTDLPEEVETPYHFRVRFAPDEIGTWVFTVKIFLPHGLGTLEHTGCDDYAGYQFNCVSSDSKGYLEVGAHNYLRFSETGGSFFAVGHNIFGIEGNVTDPDPIELRRSEFNKYIGYIDDFGSSGNYVRVAISNLLSGMEYTTLGVYDKDPDFAGLTRQMYAFLYDSVFNLAQSKDFYIHMNLEHFNTHMFSGSTSDWNYDTYKTTLGLTNDPKDFFTDGTAIRAFKNRLRYIIARWGYSTNLATYELFSELDWCGYDFNNVNHNPTEFSLPNNYDLQLAALDWHTIMYSYVRDSLQQKQLLTTSFAGRDPGNLFFSDSYVDITNMHIYDGSRNCNWQGRWGPDSAYLSIYNKPVILGEMGTSYPEWEVHIGSDYPVKSILHNNLWATAFMGSYGAGLNWYWAPVELYFPDFIPENNKLKNFMQDIDFENITFVPVRVPDGSEMNGTTSGQTNPAEIFYLKNPDLIIGWVHNATNYWYNRTYDWHASKEAFDLNYPSYSNQDPVHYPYPPEDINDAANSITGGILGLVPPDKDIYGDVIETPDIFLNIFDMPTQTYNVQRYNIIDDTWDNLGNTTVDLDGEFSFNFGTLDDEVPDFAFKIAPAPALIARHGSNSVLPTKLNSIAASSKKIDINKKIIHTKSESLKSSFSVFPNPTRKQTRISLTLENTFDVSIIITNNLGETVSVLTNKEIKENGNAEFILDVSHFGPGMYFCTLSATGQSETNKGQVIKEIKKLVVMSH